MDPTNIPATILQEAIFIYNNTNPPKRIANVDVSPIEPGIVPINDSIQVYASDAFGRPSLAAKESIVAPLYPSTAVQTASPLMYAGYAKYKKALPVKAGFRKFFPVPPKISFPITTPKLIPIATIQSGKSGGQLSENKIDVTKNPS